MMFQGSNRSAFSTVCHFPYLFLVLEPSFPQGGNQTSYESLLSTRIGQRHCRSSNDDLSYLVQGDLFWKAK